MVEQQPWRRTTASLGSSFAENLYGTVDWGWAAWSRWGTNRALATPDFDVWVDIDNDEQVEAFYFSDVSWPPPAGVPRQNAYRFAVEPTDIQIREW